jgi:hypothetical protein
MHRIASSQAANLPSFPYQSLAFLGDAQEEIDMLFDKRWLKPKTIEPSLEGLIEWLEKQPPKGEYDWSDTSMSPGCVGQQYLKAVGLTKKDLCCYLPLTTFIFNGDTKACAIVTLERPWTFGAALARARQLCPSSPS